ncbi:tRNA(His) guanylyltransferase Thg1 family protein [Hymenobacter sp. GOD-10R]|uniref:tRNA(His) guanylyltransferase Thg1 family protein n=1 Tax=Hymenobacter sp. GOD-10R TaxID=3093922 RepID=UPI002D794B94|nr:tRNA(His) guanylyltransferase Thg1 family protein [Hymenobacter sp. GOD-10R]WRQ31227.1 tRNA(His) guanylyltransferase Thg1 family protein [Hymenobacter sp. GOD-10R]
MKFDELDTRMRVFETAHDHCVLPGLYLVARLDGRGFTRLTKEVHPFEAPFDERMRELMTSTVTHLLGCGFRISYGYTQSDEISLLLHPEENTFGRKLRKYNSVLAGEASAAFSLKLGAVGVFDCRISQLPREQDVVDYFRWRQEDAGRNALNAHCYWALRKQGQSVAEATGQVLGIGTAAKHDLLFAHGINYNSVPAWQKRGVGLYWETYDKPGFNPLTQETVHTVRRRLKTDLELPLGEAYASFIQTLLHQEQGQES